MRDFLFFTLLVSAIFVLQSCAHKVAPTGGEKDIKVPELIDAEPTNQSVNFTSEKILLTFSEYVQLIDIQKQLLISPPITPAPEIEIRKKSVLITFLDTLSSNTTYSINFGNAIADFTEGNVLAGFQYVFSTGTFLDSSIVSGVLHDALTLKADSNALAMLYDSEIADSIIGISSPLYYARTNGNGMFTIRNIRKGSYRIIGLDDKNSNFTAEFADESIGAGTQNLELGDSLFVSMKLAKQPPPNQVIKSATTEPPGKLITVFSRSVENPQWKFISREPEKVDVVISETRDSVLLYCFPALSDSTQIIWYDQGSIIDTVGYRLAKSKIAKRDSVFKLTASTFPQSGVLPAETNPHVKWVSPLKDIDFNKMLVFKDSTEIPVKKVFADSMRTIIAFENEWKEGSYMVFIPSNAATDVYGLSNDTIQFSFTVAPENSVGSISYQINTEIPGNLLLQLVNNKDEMIRQRIVNAKSEGIFVKVDPGVYHLRVIIDENGNNHWDAGELRKRIWPEQVIYYAEPITVRANWEVEIVWTPIMKE